MNRVGPAQYCEHLQRTHITALTAMMTTLLIAVTSPSNKTMQHAAADAAAPPLHHEPELSHIPTQTQRHIRLRVQTLCRQTDAYPVCRDK